MVRIKIVKLPLKIRSFKPQLMAGAKFRYYSGPEKQKSPDRLFRSGDYPFYHQNPAGALLSSKYRPNMQAGLLTSPPFQRLPISVLETVA